MTRAVLMLLAASSGPWAIRTRRSRRRRRFKLRMTPQMATGLVQRVAGQEDLCPDNDCTYQYLNDATGNCVGVVCAGGGSVGGSCSSANLYAVRFTRMDAWPWTRRGPRSGQEPQARGLRPPRRVQGAGNLISPVYLDGLPPALPVADVDCTASTADGCEPADGMPQAEALAGPYQPWTRRVPRSGYEPQARGLRPPRRVQGQYHGSDRYETDLIDMDKLRRPDGGQPSPGAGRSTGFVHVGVRYYEPATGRFLQHDPMFIDPTPFAWGQHNRWVYCANDPVNFDDRGGGVIGFDDVLYVLAFAVLVGALSGLTNVAAGGEFAAGFVGGFVAGLGILFGPAGIVIGNALGNFITAKMNGKCNSTALLYAFIGAIFAYLGIGMAQAADGKWAILAANATIAWFVNVLYSTFDLIGGIVTGG